MEKSLTSVRKEIVLAMILEDPELANFVKALVTWYL